MCDLKKTILFDCNEHPCDITLPPHILISSSNVQAHCYLKGNASASP